MLCNVNIRNDVNCVISTFNIISRYNIHVYLNFNSRIWTILTTLSIRTSWFQWKAGVILFILCIVIAVLLILYILDVHFNLFTWTFKFIEFPWCKHVFYENMLTQTFLHTKKLKFSQRESKIIIFKLFYYLEIIQINPPSSAECNCGYRPIHSLIILSRCYKINQMINQILQHHPPP